MLPNLGYIPSMFLALFHSEQRIYIIIASSSSIKNNYNRKIERCYFNHAATLFHKLVGKRSQFYSTKIESEDEMCAENCPAFKGSHFDSLSRKKKYNFRLLKNAICVLCLINMQSSSMAEGWQALLPTEENPASTDFSDATILRSYCFPQIFQEKNLE